jgi:transposase
LEVIPMSKRSYRSVSVNSVKRDELLDKVRDRSLVLGIDVAKTDLKVAVMERATREVLAILHWSAPQETRAFVSLVSSLKEVAPIEVALEPTGTYGDVLKAMLTAIEVPVFRVSAKHTSDASELYDNVPSQHDAKCAAIVAHLHAEGRSARWVDYSVECRDLMAAVEIMVLFDKQEQGCVGRLEGKLARHFPELPKLLELTSATLLALLEQFCDPATIAARATEARDLMRRVGGPLLSADKIEAIVEAARTTTGVAMSSGERAMMAALARETNRQRKEAHAAAKIVERLGAEIEAVKRMAPVIGARTGAVVYAEAGDPASYKAADAFVKVLGLNLKIKNSGKPADVGRLRITKRGSPKARMYLYMAVLRLIQSDKAFAAWYQRKVGRDNGRHKLRAVVALMRKLASSLPHVARGESFNSARLFDTERLGLTA